MRQAWVGYSVRRPYWGPSWVSLRGLFRRRCAVLSRPNPGSFFFSLEQLRLLWALFSRWEQRVRALPWSARWTLGALVRVFAW